MKPEPLELSIVIIARPQSATLRRLLNALETQTVPPQRFEVIVVGGDDASAAMTSEAQATPFRLAVVGRQPGRSAARNAGAAAAAGPLLLFLADDLDPRATMVEAHLAGHAQKPGRILIGPYPPAASSQESYLAMSVRAQWHDLFTALGRRDHRSTFRDCLGGNLSLSSDLFRQLGGFHDAFPGPRGDHEFGVRAIEAGVALAFIPEAGAVRRSAPETGRGAFARIRDEAIADALLGSLHPDIRPSLPLAIFGEPPTRLQRLHHRLSLGFPRITDGLAGFVARGLPLCERLQLRSQWHRLFKLLARHWYLRGLATRFVSREVLYQFVKEGLPAKPREPEFVVDLRMGIDHAIAEVDRARPSSVAIILDDSIVGHLPPLAGAEPLRGVDLRAALAGDLIWPLFKLLTTTAAVGKSLEGLPMGQRPPFAASRPPDPHGH